MRTRSLVLIAAVGLALGAIGTWLVLASDHLENKAAFLSLALTVGLSFLVSGVIALWRRPDNRTGFLLVLVAYLWFLGGLTESDNDWIFTIGVLVEQPRAGCLRPPAARVPDGPAARAQGFLARRQHVRARLRRLPRPAAGRRAAGLELRDLREHDRRHEQRHRPHTRPRPRQRARARARGRRVRDRDLALPARPRRTAPRARPGPRHGSARHGRPLRPADRGHGLGGRCRPALLRLPGRVRARAGGVPGRGAPEPARAIRRRRAPARAVTGDARSATRWHRRSRIRRSTSSTGSPSASSSSCRTAPRSKARAASASGTT